MGKRKSENRRYNETERVYVYVCVKERERGREGEEARISYV
jgi:hypothetical protein